MIICLCYKVFTGLLLSSGLSHFVFTPQYDLLETADRMYVRFGAGEKRYFGVYDKSRGGGVYCEASRIGDDLGLGGVPWMSGVDGDRFFGRTTDPETMASEVVWL